MVPVVPNGIAQAEIEYQDQKDPSIYVRFALPEANRKITLS